MSNETSPISNSEIDDSQSTAEKESRKGLPGEIIVVEATPEQLEMLEEKWPQWQRELIRDLEEVREQLPLADAELLNTFSVNLD